MRKYTVLWSPFSERKLAELWEAATDRQRLTDAADQLDSELAGDPLVIGESRQGDERIAFSFPLGVVYSVDKEDKVVVVHWVWRIGQR